MIVYLLAFERPIGTKGRGTARHYLGWAESFDSFVKRMYLHWNGLSGVKIIREFFEQGIRFTIARIWQGATRHFERRKKLNGHLERLFRIEDLTDSHLRSKGYRRADKPPICLQRIRLRDVDPEFLELHKESIQSIAVL